LLNKTIDRKDNPKELLRYLVIPHIMYKNKGDEHEKI